MDSQSFDYIVIGAGSAGAIIAARLSEDKNLSVLLLEAGEFSDRYIYSRPPGGVKFMMDNPAVNWRYQAEPDPSYANRRIHVPRGKMMGGSSGINGTIYNRGIPLDYDTWAQMGCRGWSFDDVLPYLKKIESTKLGEDAYRGRRGPVKVTEAAKLSSFYDLFIDSAKNVGIPFNSDYSGATQEGVALAQQTVNHGLRHSSSTQYLRPARFRRNLTVLRGAEATQLILEDKCCTGVRYRRKGREHIATARAEVILSGGTANSPKLLELSGIGDEKRLQALGIRPLHHLPGVGESLRDHYGAIMKWRFNKPGISIAKLGRGWRLWREVARYGLFRSGFIAQGIGTLRVFTKSRPELEETDIMMVVAPYLVDHKNGKSREMSPVEGFFMYSHMQRTETTGSIHAASSDPSVPPAIRFRFLGTQRERDTSIAAVRKAREVMAAQPIAQYVAEEMQPGPLIQTDEEILDFIRQEGQITHHMVGTCRMGHDPMAVVDDRLRVHGLEGLRVADGSIMPTIISGNTSVPCMMIGEKCADLIREDRRAARRV